MDINGFDLTQLQQAGAQRAEARAGASIQALKASKAPTAVRAAAESFEAIFISQMLAPIFETVATDGPFGGGHAERIFRSLQVEEMGKAIAKKGGFGIADSVVREILKTQEF